MKVIVKNNLAVLEMVLLIAIIGMVLFILSEVQLLPNNSQSSGSENSVQRSMELAQVDHHLSEQFNINQICG